MEASEPPEKNPNQGGCRDKCVKGLLSASYVKLTHFLRD